MLTLKLLRFATSRVGCHGVLIYDSGVPICATLEEPWRDNARNISCIPTGTYSVTKYSGTRHKNAFWVHDVQDRDAILIHEGNTVANTAGCILVGTFAPHGLDNSREAMRRLNIVLPREFILEVKNVF